MPDECKCVTCPDCHGLGRLEVLTGSYPEYEYEGCITCDGDGRIEICEACQRREDDAEIEEQCREYGNA